VQLSIQVDQPLRDGWMNWFIALSAAAMHVLATAISPFQQQHTCNA
jgi:hypothetical protein